MNMSADDGKLLKKFVRLDGCKEFHKDLNKLNEWSENGLKKFNTSKCKVMHMGKSKLQPTMNSLIIVR